MPSIVVQANCNWQKITERRQKVEALRQNKIARVRSDLDRVVKRELEYTKELLDIIVPVKLVWDADAWNRVKDFIPVRVEVKAVEEEAKEEEVKDSQSA